MRTFILGEAPNFTTTAPAVVAFAFNRLPFTVRHSTASTLTVSVVIKQGDIELGSEEREGFGGHVAFDVQRYVQMAFRDLTLSQTATQSTSVAIPSEMQKTFTVSIYAQATVSEGVNEYLTIDIPTDVIFGAISIGEDSMDPLRIRLYPNLPQTFDLMANNLTSLYFLEIRGSGAFETITLPDPEATASGYQMVNVNITGKAAGYSRVRISARPTLAITGGIVEAPATRETIADVDPSTCGVYLRWLDRHGRWQYFLFRETANSCEASEVDEWEVAMINDPLVYIDGLNDDISTRRQYEMRRRRTLTAQLVDEGLRKLLLSLTMAVVVDEYDGGNKWHRVSLVPGKMAENYQPLQNFSIEIEEPVELSQIP